MCAISSTGFQIESVETCHQVLDVWHARNFMEFDVYVDVGVC